MFTQVVDTLFSRLLACKERWVTSGITSETPPVYGSTDQLSEPQELGVDYKRLKRVAAEEFASRQNLIGEILPAEAAQKAQHMFDVRRFRISSLLWVHIVYSFLKAYSCASNRAEKLRIVAALKPLYFARVVSFIRETLELSHVQSEKKILRQGVIFRSNRNLLIRELT